MELHRRHPHRFLWALLLAPPVLLVPLTTGLHAAKSPPMPLAGAGPTKERPSSRFWVDDLALALTQHFAKKYPRYAFEPFTQELDRIRDAIARGDRVGARREVGVFLKMAAGLASNLGQDAAAELTGLTRQLMPEEEFAIVYPGLWPTP